MFATAVKRGCGERQSGGVYFEMGMSPIGSPIEDFLCDPPLLITEEMKATMGVASIGTSWLPEYERHLGDIARDLQHQPIVKTWHILDVIGQEHYATVSRFVEEGRRFGISRRLAANLDWSRVSRDTKLYAAHAKAYVSHTQDFERWFCPKYNVMHSPIAAPRIMKPHGSDYHGGPTSPGYIQELFCCAGVWWEDETGDPISNATMELLEKTFRDDPTSDRAKDLKKYLLGPDRADWWDIYGGDPSRLVEVKMPSLSFIARKRPEGLPEPEYQLAIFGRFPLGRIAVVKGGEAERNLERAEAAAVNGVLVEGVDQ